jgi:hypothetical protein
MSQFKLWFDILLSASVNPSTVKQYDIGWRYWKEFAIQCNFGYLPSEHVGCHCQLGSISKQHMAALAVLFCAHQFFELHKSASTVTGYLSGVAFHLNKSGEDSSFFSCPQVTMVRSGLRKLHTQHRTKSKDKLPFSLEMILAYTRHVNSFDFTLSNFGTSVALLLAFSCLLRASEYVPSSSKKHWIRACDVQFVLSDGRVVPSYLFLAHWVELVSEVIIHIRSSKTDQDGCGFNFFFDINSSSRPLVVALMRWSMLSSLSEHLPFFSATNNQGKQIWCLHRTHLSKAMRFTAINLFSFSILEAKRFTPHSLRYGGASALAAANLPDYSIKLAGRWKSDAFLIYVKETCQKFALIHDALANPSILVANDILRLARANSSTKPSIPLRK